MFTTQKVLLSWLRGPLRMNPQCRVTRSVVTGRVELGIGAKVHRAELHGPISLGAYTTFYAANIHLFAWRNRIAIGSYCSIANHVETQRG